MIYINYQAIINIAKQNSFNTISIVKLNLKYIRLLKYLSWFYLNIQYKPGKSNIILNALLYLPIIIKALPIIIKTRKHLL